MEHKEVLKRFKKLGLVTADGQPISFNAFKDRSSVHRYGLRKNNMQKILFTGHPRENLWGFFLPIQNDKDFLKQAYGIFKKVVNGDMEWFETNLVHGKAAIQFGNCGIPLAYGNLRKIEE